MDSLQLMFPFGLHKKNYKNLLGGSETLITHYYYYYLHNPGNSDNKAETGLSQAEIYPSAVFRCRLQLSVFLPPNQIKTPVSSTTQII